MFFKSLRCQIAKRPSFSVNFHRSSGSYKEYPVDLKMPAIFPNNLTRKHKAVFPKSSDCLNINFRIFHITLH